MLSYISSKYGQRLIVRFSLRKLLTNSRYVVIILSVSFVPTRLGWLLNLHKDKKNKKQKQQQQQQNKQTKKKKKRPFVNKLHSNNNEDDDNNKIIVSHT